jgi:hypothetical protein
MKTIVAWMGLMLLPSLAFAADALPTDAPSVDTPPPLARPAVPAAHFMSLASERNGSARILATTRMNAKPAPAAAPRSDMQALNSGFMRIDRNRALAPSGMAPLPRNSAAAMNPLSVSPASPTLPGASPLVTRGNDHSVAALDNEEIGNRLAATPGAANNPVLNLFNATDSKTLPSFHDALRASGASASLTRLSQQGVALPAAAAPMIDAPPAAPTMRAPMSANSIRVASVAGVQ